MQRNRISHRSRRASRLTDERPFSPLSCIRRGQEMQIPNSITWYPRSHWQRSWRGWCTRPSLTPPLVSSLYLPLFISLDTPANSHSCMHRERIELFRFSACQESLSPSSRSRKHPTLERDCRILPRWLRQLQSRKNRELRRRLNPRVAKSPNCRTRRKVYSSFFSMLKEIIWHLIFLIYIFNI